jgi:Glycosyl transferase family 2
MKMEYLRRASFDKPPLFSFVLLDWSVRESFHTLDYLSHQKIDRSLFEVIWIEYYNRRSEQIEQRISNSERLGTPSPVDTWIVMHHSETETYHKHRMYNQGILDATGSIVVVLDSDAVLRTDLLQTLVDEYEEQPDLVLHFEQIRNFNQMFYPFNFPNMEAINGEGCVNATKGVPHGFDTCAKSLAKDWTLWNRYNYGACFSARRDDLIRIGGADEHIDYMGHICGPYEMTARLINADLPDKLHPTHYLYHVWHPNQGGTNNYSGPSDGRGMSLTAMEIPNSVRILPLEENEDIKKLRLDQEAVSPSN